MSMLTKCDFVRSFEVSLKLVNNWSFPSSSKYKILFYKGIRHFLLEGNISAIDVYFVASPYIEPDLL